MSNAARAISPIIAIIISVGNSVSDFTSNTVAVFLWALSTVLVIVALLWPYLRRLCVGLKPPDAELQRVTEERDSWQKSYSESQQRLQELENREEQRLQQIRELEQELDELRQSYEEVYAQLDTQHNDDKLQEEASRLAQNLYQFAEERNTDALQEELDKTALDGTGEDFIALSSAKGRNDDQTKTLFNQRYESDVWALLRALERKEWCSNEERKEVESVFQGNWLSDPAQQIKKGAARIAAFGKRYYRFKLRLFQILTK